MRRVIVIPTYDERENLPHLVEEVLGVTDADVLIVDSDSKDGTGAEADRLASQRSRVAVVHHGPAEGPWAALRDGFRVAIDRGYDAIAQMDADFSHQPRYLPSLFSALDEADVAIGSRYVGEGKIATGGLARRLVSLGGNTYAQRVLATPVRDLTSGYVAYRRHALEALDIGAIASHASIFQIELKFRAHRAGFQLVEVPIVYYDRVAGVSKLKAESVASAIWRVAALRATEAVR